MKRAREPDRAGEVAQVNASATLPLSFTVPPSKFYDHFMNGFY